MIKITDNFTIYDTPDLLEVCGIELVAADIIPYIGDRKTLRIMADRFHLNGAIIVPAGDVLVAARQILGGDGSAIDVSGRNGRDAPSTPKPKPVNAAAPAPHGEDGPELGGNAGRIRLIALHVDGAVRLMANGGRGSAGQPGGNAADGVHGHPSNEDSREGGKGGNAGPIGRAGASRDSGNGGTIEVMVDQGGESIERSVLRGPAVAAVPHGQPGAPGTGGRGGEVWVCTREPEVWGDNPRGLSPLVMEKCDPTGRYHPNGADGVASPPIDTPPVAGLEGKDGVVTAGALSGHRAEVPFRGLRLLLLEAEILHIQAMSSDRTAEISAKAAMEMAGFVFIAALGSLDPAVGEIRSRASALMHRIASGSAPEGTAGLEVSLTPLPVILDSLKVSMESRWRGSTYIEALKLDARHEDQIQNAINAVRGQAVSIRSHGAGRLEELSERRGKVVETINVLSTSYRSIWKEVQNADREFREEVARRNPCADFLNITILVATVAVTVISAGSATAAAVAAGSEILAYIDKDKERQEIYQKEIAEAGGLKTRLDGYAKGAQDLANNAARLKELLGGDALTPPEDHIRLGMTREDFNKMIDPYRGMGATEELKRRMDRFFSLVETRNSLLLEHDQIVIEIATIRARMDTAQQQLDDLVVRDGAALIDATIETYEAALWIDIEAGKRLMGMLQAANKAYEYLSLRPRSMPLSTTRGDNLEDEFRRLVNDTALLLRPDELSREVVCEITISNDSHPETFAALLAGDDAVVSLMPEHVDPAQKERWDERAYAVGIKINGIKASSRNPVSLSAKMQSCGIAWFRKRDGSQVSMRIPMRDADEILVSTSLDLDEVRSSRNLIGSESSTVEASPYGLWRITVPGIDNLLKRRDGKPDKDTLKELSLTFCFIGTARISHKVALIVNRQRDGLKAMLQRPQFDPLVISVMTDGTPDQSNVETLSQATDLHQVWEGSAFEEPMMVRMVEDMIHVQQIYGKRTGSATMDADPG